MRITHVVVTDAFAGTERYVATVSALLAARGHHVRVLGGAGNRMLPELGGATWSPAPSVLAAVSQLSRGGRQEVVHAHLTSAEAAAILAKPFHRAALMSTRHIAATRGSSRGGRLAAPIIARSLKIELAISEFVAGAIGSEVDGVLLNGVPASDGTYDTASRTVLVLQRLEPEKATSTAIEAWRLSGLGKQGWRLDVAGDGAQRSALTDQVARSEIKGVHLLGSVADAPRLLRRAAVLLAPAPAEPLGLSVLEAMAAGVPVVAAAGGGHLETVTEQTGVLFPPGDAAAAAAQLKALAADPARRAELGAAARLRQRQHFDLADHVTHLEQTYATAVGG